MSAPPEIDVAAFRARLIALRSELRSLVVSSAESVQVVELDQAKVGRLSRMDAMQAQAMAQASSQRREQMLKQIQAALTRLDKDEFGYCRDCDEQIPVRRLEFDPTSTRCVVCAGAAES